MAHVGIHWGLGRRGVRAEKVRVSNLGHNRVSCSKPHRQNLEEKYDPNPQKLPSVVPALPPSPTIPIA